MYETAAGSSGGEKSGKPWHGLVCFFDPSSVKVSLNPQVFTADEIRTAQVTAVCGVRKGTNFDRYEQYRTAQKLKNAKHHVNSTRQFPNRPTSEAPFNAYGRGVHQFSADPVDKNEVGYIGGGDDNYLIDPVGLRGQSDTKWGDYYLPTYEVTVSVKIKLDSGKTIVLSRSYLPEIKDIVLSSVLDYYNNLKDRKIGMPDHYMKSLYDEQVKHIGEICHWICFTPIIDNGSPIRTSYYDSEDDCWYRKTWNDNPQCAFSRLLDGDKKSKWASHVSNRYEKNTDNSYSKTVAKGMNHNCWFVEFRPGFRARTKSFTLTSSDTGDNKKPRDIRLFGRFSCLDEWEQIFMKDGINMPSGPNTEMTFEIPADKQNVYEEYRFEVGANCGGDWLDLNELTMNWER